MLSAVTPAGAEPTKDAGDPAAGNGMNAAPRASVPAGDGRVKLTFQATTLDGAFDGAAFASAIPRGTFICWVRTIGLWPLVAVLAVLLAAGTAVSIHVRCVAR